MRTNVLRVAQAIVLLLVGLLLGVGLHSATSQGVHVMPAGSEVGRYQMVPPEREATPLSTSLIPKQGGYGCRIHRGMTGSAPMPRWMPPSKKSRFQTLMNDLYRTR